MSTIPRRLQLKTVQMLDSVPPGTRCPCCHHSFDVVVSSRQILCSALSRQLMHHFHCQVCGSRFRALKLVVLGKLAALGLIGFCVIGLAVLLRGPLG